MTNSISRLLAGTAIALAPLSPAFAQSAQERAGGDDFHNRQGDDLNHNGNTEWGDAYNYCVDNWCIRDPDKNSLFPAGSRMDPVTCDEPYDSSLEDMVKNAPPELLKICGREPSCLIEGLGGDVADAIDSVATLKENGVEVVPYEEEQENTRSTEEEDKIVSLSSRAPRRIPPSNRRSIADPSLAHSSSTV